VEAVGAFTSGAFSVIYLTGESTMTGTLIRQHVPTAKIRRRLPPAAFHVRPVCAVGREPEDHGHDD
jgi:hypothetical protein